MTYRNNTFFKIGTIIIVLLLLVIVFLIFRINSEKVLRQADPISDLSPNGNVESLSGLVADNKLTSDALNNLAQINQQTIQDITSQDTLNLEETIRSELSNSFISEYSNFITVFNSSWLILEIPSEQFNLDPNLNNYFITPSPESQGLKIIYSIDNQNYINIEDEVVDIKLQDNVLYYLDSKSFIQYNSFVFPSIVSQNFINYISKPNSLIIGENYKSIFYTTNQILNNTYKSIYLLENTDSFQQSKDFIVLDNLYNQIKVEQDTPFEERNLPQPNIDDTDAPEFITKDPAVQILKFNNDNMIISVTYQKLELYKINTNTREISKLYQGGLFTDVFTNCNKNECIVIDCDLNQAFKINTEHNISNVLTNQCNDLKTNFRDVITSNDSYIKYYPYTSSYNFWDTKLKSLTKLILN